MPLAMPIKTAFKKKGENGASAAQGRGATVSQGDGTNQEHLPCCMSRAVFLCAGLAPGEVFSSFFNLHWTRSVSEPVLVEIDASRTAAEFCAVAIACHATATESCRSSKVINAIATDFELPMISTRSIAVT